jgi:hypothetical protein
MLQVVSFSLRVRADPGRRAVGSIGRVCEPFSLLSSVSLTRLLEVYSLSPDRSAHTLSLYAPSADENVTPAISPSVAALAINLMLTLSTLHFHTLSHTPPS